MQLQFKGEVIDLSKNGDKYGIGKLKEVALGLANVWPEIHKRAADGNFSFWDVLFTGVDIAKQGTQIVLNFRQLEAEAKDLSQAEAKELAAFLVQNLNISQFKAELFVERILFATITMIYTGIEVYNAVDDFVK